MMALIFRVTVRQLHTYNKLFKNVPVKLKSQSSREWLIRQMKDPYVEKAKTENYRCRSAFKLIEIDNKYKLLQPGMIVVDCGAAPGSWSQVAVNRVNSIPSNPCKKKGIVISADLISIYPLNGSIVLPCCDLSLVDVSFKMISQILCDKKVDAFLSDMAPNASGIKSADHDAIINLAFCVLRLAIKLSKEGSFLLVKLWDGNSVQKLISCLEKYYKEVRRVKPPASRSNSSEIYLLAQDFKSESCQ